MRKLSSMTGFGRSICDVPSGKLTVEIQSVNRRYLEIFLSLPKELARFEPEIRKLMQERLIRGQVSLRVYFSPNLEGVESLLPDIKMLKRLKKAWRKIAKDLDFDAQQIDLPFIMQYLPVLSRPDLSFEEDRFTLSQCVDKALDHLMEMKKIEGAALAKDLSKRLEQCRVMVADVEELAPQAAEKMRLKLREKIEEVLGGKEAEDRILKEVAIFAERVDITEEVIRLQSHISQFQELLQESIVGRKMDFLLQEMSREVNTIGSKAQESQMSRIIVDMKSELEKMREQVQNIE
ncbi:MAG: YicC family protein [Chlamydiae bacterium RIFCSPHIGHO2_12_FULL_44_59]|nr:MAG: YicC family protein [Chlamydiae bacterium RIFCSPHIGHO2_01_FULL_44_39]OGN59090.1 MAG: YicC family protein [Chlamydiae bacterium RIFCSPHIGHO2_02_FULL_45_9]OGN60288.1 MAG: YicC family protein [Chlamydiae bacterium RIFCSPHIGHO2_12_FULL_44_59]OGN67059.1 MAG: YicC family protein [Chlamydiae bacterium RIFCSPLOWO2_01_FULL_44_52]OGN67649.1 MAG: YicC family protein [Chlamydiae bacterium RIFCSPLOWO2_02_FULL_45_22]OGN71352.1 MAG: YicC family protein [Chlamydiae bacterium RIFCSPLOWO2_12_FULL_45_20]